MNWLLKKSQYYDDYDSSEFQYYKYFPEESDQYDDLSKWLTELYKTEYAIGELKMRKQVNPRLEYWAGGRIDRWIQKLYDHSLPLAMKAGSQMLATLNNWLGFHTGSNFVDEILGDGTEWRERNITEDGIILLGGDFRFDIKPYVLEPFLRQNLWFVQDFWNEILPNLAEDRTPEEMQHFENFSDEDILQYVKEEIETIYYQFNDMIEYLEQYTSIDQTLEEVIMKYVYPAWREHWGSSLEVAEENVTEARDRLAQDLQSKDISQLFVSINLALHAEHVHGTMSEHIEIPESTLNYLSNLDTEEIDNFVDSITGKNWKTARIEKTRNWLKKAVFNNI